MENDSDLTIARLAPLIKKKKISPVELTKYCLERIDRLQPSINAYITVTPDIALAQARRAERAIMRGHYLGTLHGIPLNIKDLYFTKGIRTTAGSGVLKDFVPNENAEIVQRLLDSGCILLGKTNMHEFAFGSTNAHSYFGPVHNPWDTNRISGGSSGGSAASVISAQAIASFGTDTGGSIRIPSAACGCVGFKPTYGRFPLGGVIPLSPTLDHAGPITRCVLDSALLLNAVQPLHIPQDTRLLARELETGAEALVIGVPRQYFFDRIQPEVRRSMLESIKIFKELGVRVRKVNLKSMEETERIAAEITGSDALAFHEKWLETKSPDYGEDVRSRLEQSRGRTAIAYIRALQAKDVLSHEFCQVLETVDLILGPTLPLAAPPISETEIKWGESTEAVRTAMLRLTRPANLTGLPAISIPCGFTKERLPLGLQLIGRAYEELTVLRAAYAYENATPWHNQFPR